MEVVIFADQLKPMKAPQVIAAVIHHYAVRGTVVVTESDVHASSPSRLELAPRITLSLSTPAKVTGISIRGYETVIHLTVAHAVLEVTPDGRVLRARLTD